MNTQRRISTVASQLYKLVGAFVLVLILTGLLSYFTLSRLKVNGPVYSQIVLQKDLLADILPPPMYIIESYLTIMQMPGESDTDTLKEEIAKIMSLKKDFESRTEYWDKELADSPVRQKLLEEAHKPAVAFFETVEKEFIPLIQNKDTSAATALAYGKLRQLYLEHRKAIDDVVVLALQNSELYELEAKKEVKNRTWILVGTLVGGLIIIGIYSFFAALKVTSILKTITYEISHAIEEMAAATRQVSGSSQSLAEGASESSASLEEAGSSLEEMASMTKRNANNTKEANNLAKEARAAAETGTSGMREMNAAMESIKVSSDDIAKIIKTIDEIAFQTNLLALNAAVEAARAGEAGMGFAVVADEVRNLAQRCANAAKETTAKIEGAIDNTTHGVEICKKVAQALDDIEVKTQQVDELVAEVAGASYEQSQGIDQINTAVAQMEKVTQANTASAEESAAASEELSAQASKMKASVEYLLKLVGAGQTGSGPAAAKPIGKAVISPAKPFQTERSLPARRSEF